MLNATYNRRSTERTTATCFYSMVNKGSAFSPHPEYRRACFRFKSVDSNHHVAGKDMGVRFYGCRVLRRNKMQATVI
jgi:hypothetical protein